MYGGTGQGANRSRPEHLLGYERFICHDTIKEDESWNQPDGCLWRNICGTDKEMGKDVEKSKLKVGEIPRQAV